MNREQTKQWLPEIIAFAEGKTLWLYNNKTWCIMKSLTFLIDSIIVIEDKHFEARKAFALGEPIECTCGITTSFKNCINPSWCDMCTYRPKSKQWYDEVSKERPILCWVWDRGEVKMGALVNEYQAHTDYKFVDNLHSNSWENAEPIKPEECWKGLTDENN